MSEPRTALATPISSVTAMRRTVAPVLLASIMVVGLVACGSDGDSSSDTTGSQAPAGSDAAGDSSPAPGSDAATSDAPSSTSADKPEVEIPAEIPTELKVTVLEEGTGPAAQNGDTVVVAYVGVRSSDGVEFDNSYDRGEPLPVVLGSGGVIQGWEQGLVGAQAGQRNFDARGPGSGGYEIGIDAVDGWLIHRREGFGQPCQRVSL